MGKEIDKYEDIYSKLKKCFEIAFGDGVKGGVISMNEVRQLMRVRSRPDDLNSLPRNSLIEIPEDLYEALKDTFTSRDSLCVSGLIGCTDDPAEQLDGITNMALLMYLSNHISKSCRIAYHGEKNIDIKKNLKRTEKGLLLWKDIALSDLIASIYVLSKTSKEFENYLSYGSRLDDENKPSFAIDLPYIGQLCVHFGWEERKQIVLKRAKGTVQSILEKKLELGQVTEEQLHNITTDLETDGVLPEYEGKLYEYVGIMPVEFAGEGVEKYRKMLGNKLPEEITRKDTGMLVRQGLNDREL